MRLDDEKQRQVLLQIINALPINGNLEQVSKTAQVLSSLAQEISKAKLEGQPSINLPESAQEVIK